MSQSFLMTILTCQGREEALAATLEALKLTDWKEEPLIRPDKYNLEDRCASQIKASKDILEEALTLPGWDYLLFCEDDISFNYHLRRNVSRWLPIVQGFCLVGTLYHQPEYRPTEFPDYYPILPSNVGDSQAVVIKRSWLPRVLELWESYPAPFMQGLRMFRSLFKIGLPVYVHTPGLVQHENYASTWKGLPHKSKTFIEDWRCV